MALFHLELVWLDTSCYSSSY